MSAGSADRDGGPHAGAATGTRRPPTRILGVLNVSPESNVTESIARTPREVRDRADMLVRAGADWIDLGARSITPEATKIDDREEQSRLLPALDLLRKDHVDTPISVDTWSGETAVAALERGADAINFTAGTTPEPLLDAVASRRAMLVLTFMPYENAYAMRDATPASVGLEAVLDHLAPRVEQARAAGIEGLVVDPNLGIFHPATSDTAKIHQQLEIVWNLDRLRVLGCPILLYAARKPERLARILIASAILHAGADYVRAHDPALIRELEREATTPA
jgi:dihydropteroate synthase